MLYSNRFKILFFLFLFSFSFFNFAYASADTFKPDFFVEYNSVPYPGKIVYFSNYIFDIDFLYHLNQEAFKSSSNALPLFDNFYCKVILPDGTLRWALCVFADSSINILPLELSTSNSIDILYDSNLLYYEKDVNTLDWTIVFSNNIEIIFVNKLNGSIYEQLDFCKMN